MTEYSPLIVSTNEDDESPRTLLAPGTRYVELMVACTQELEGDAQSSNGLCKDGAFAS